MNNSKRVVDDYIPMDIRMILPCAGWITRNPRLTNALIIVGLLALAWVAFTYEFTIPAYK